MKNIYKLCSFLLVVFIGMYFLAGCGGSVKGSMEITAKRNSIDVEVTISDPKEECGAVSCAIFSVVDDKEDEKITTKEVSLNSSNVGNVSFTKLDEESKFVIYLYANVNGKKQTLEKQEASTTQTGSEDDPIVITSFEELLDVSKDKEAHYELGNDIDCDGDDIVPFFDSSTTFTGSFDGKGYKIHNFGIFQDGSSTTTYKQYSGLFGYNKGTIKNVVLENVKLTSSRGGETFVGVLCGKNEGEISNVTAKNITMTIKSTGSGFQHIGGLVGQNGDKSKLINCHVEGLDMTLTTKNKLQMGGLVGTNAEPSIKKYAPVVESCSVIGKVKVEQKATYTSEITNYIGGLVGFNSCLVKDCYSNVNIEMTASKTSSSVTVYTNYIGGLIGYCKTGKLVNSAAVANIKYSSSDVFEVAVGGLIGYVAEHGLIDNSVFVAQNSSIDVACRVSSYSTSTSTSDTRYAQLSDDSYVLISDLFIYNSKDNKYEALTSTNIEKGQEVYTKNESDEYTKLDKTIGTVTLFKYTDDSDAYVSAVAGNAYDLADVLGYQTKEITYKIAENCKFVTKDYEIKTSFEGLSEAVLGFIQNPGTVA